MHIPNIEEIRKNLKNYKKKYFNHAGFTRSAVIIPLIVIDNEINILFTKRTGDVRQHKGENSFPGGVFEDKDGELINTALRETQEETGIQISYIEVLGELDDYISITDFHVTPFVGLIKDLRENGKEEGKMEKKRNSKNLFRFDPKEIEEIFLIPVSHLMDEKNEDSIEISRRGNIEKVYFFWYKGRCVWGATARMLKNFFEVISEVRSQKSEVR